MSDLDKLRHALGEEITARRSRLGLTRQTLAQQAGSTRSTIDRLERGGGNPQLTTLVALCEALEVSVFDFVEAVRRRVEEPRPPRRRTRVAFEFLVDEDQAAELVEQVARHARTRRLR